MIKVQKLVDANGLLEMLFDERFRPSVRWVRDQQRAGALPFTRVGRLVFFDPDEVRATLAAKHTVHAPRFARRRFNHCRKLSPPRQCPRRYVAKKPAGE